MQNQVTASSPTGETRQHRWTAGKLAKRAAIGVTLLFAIVGGGAWMLHAGISTDGFRNIANIKAGPVRVLTRLNADSARADTHETIILSRAATSEALLLSNDPGGASRIAAKLTSGDGATIATLALRNASDQGVVDGPVLVEVDRLITIGFNGFVLDLQDFRHGELDRVARAVVRITAHVRHQRPAAFILLQEREDAVARRDVIQVIDGVFNTTASTGRTAAAPTAPTVQSAEFLARQHYLDRAVRAGKLVLVGISPDTPADVQTFFERLTASRRTENNGFRMVRVSDETRGPSTARANVEVTETISYSSTPLHGEMKLPEPK